MAWKGWVIEESLDDASILSQLKIIKIQTEENTSAGKKRIWKLYTAEVGDKNIDNVALKLAKIIKYGWYTHFTDGNTLLIIFKAKSFRIGLEKAGPEKKYGIVTFKSKIRDKQIWQAAFDYATKVAKVNPQYLIKVE